MTTTMIMTMTTRTVTVITTATPISTRK
jgi:hypothetical protein